MSRRCDCNDIIGNTFGRLKVLSCIGMIKKSYRYECVCECGNKCITLRPCLLYGNTKSCGCIRIEMTIKRSTKHGLSRTKFNDVWYQIRRRCTNKKDAAYHSYGGRGITICERWLNFLNFRDDMYKSYLDHIEIYGKNNTTIERIDNDKGYSLKNCKWATYKEQRNNQRMHKIQKWFMATRLSDGHVEISNSQRGFSRENNISRTALINRLYNKVPEKQYNGWVFEFI